MSTCEAALQMQLDEIKAAFAAWMETAHWQAASEDHFARESDRIARFERLRTAIEFVAGRPRTAIDPDIAERGMG